MWTCKYCNVDFDFNTGAKKTGHLKWCKFNPRLEETKAKLASASSKRKNPGNQYTSGVRQHTSIETREKIKSKLIGRKHSAETIEIIRAKALNSTHRRVCKKTVSYTSVTGEIVKMDSSWEVKLAQLMDFAGIVWIRPGPIQWIDALGKTHNYFPDFYLPDFDVYLDPKNDYVINKQAEKLKALKQQYSNILILSKDDICLDFLNKLEKVCHGDDA